MKQILRKYTIENLLIMGIILFLLLVISCVKEKDYSTNTNLSSQDTIFQQISPQEAYELIQSHQDDPDFMIIDVRTPGEYEEGHMEDAVNINYYSDTFRDQLDQLDKDKIYLIYCRSGSRSGAAFEIMKELEFMEVYNLQGGITQWINEGFPVVY